MRAMIRLTRHTWHTWHTGAYLQLATTAKVSPRQWQCKCKMLLQRHFLDWYGRSEPQAQWRKNVTMQIIEEVIHHVYAPEVHALSANSKPGDVRDSKRSHWHSHIIQDNETPPFTTQTSSSSSSLSNPVIDAAGSPSYLSDTVLPTEVVYELKHNYQS